MQYFSLDVLRDDDVGDALICAVGQIHYWQFLRCPMHMRSTRLSLITKVRLGNHVAGAVFYFATYGRTTIFRVYYSDAALTLNIGINAWVH